MSNFGVESCKKTPEIKERMIIMTLKIEISRQLGLELYELSREMEMNANDIIIGSVLLQYGLSYLPDYEKNPLCNGEFEKMNENRYNENINER